MKFTELNKLQMPTWRWLGLNASELDFGIDLNRPYTGASITADTEKVTLRYTNDATTDAIENVSVISNLPDDQRPIRDMVHEHHNFALTLTIPEGVQLTEPVMIDLPLDDASPILIDDIAITAGKDSRADIVVRYSSSGDSVHFHAGFATLTAAEGANIRLYKLQQLATQDLTLDANAVTVAGGADVNALFVELGGAKSVAGCNLSLAGQESRGTLDALYLGNGERVQDFSYRLELRGKASDGSISARGALAGKAKKTMKSTLDFINGASGAKGREEETVLTLSDKAVNLSVPLLLCGESDIEGAHATSSGRPDADKLYYLMSRGLTEADAKRLLVEAAFTPILNKLPTNDLREAVNTQIREMIANGNEL